MNELVIKSLSATALALSQVDDEAEDCPQRIKATQTRCRDNIPPNHILYLLEQWTMKILQITFPLFLNSSLFPTMFSSSS